LGSMRRARHAIALHGLAPAGVTLAPCGCNAEAQSRAAGRPEGHIPPQHLDDEDPAEIDVSHAISRLERIEVVGLDVADQSLEAPGLAGGEGARHPDRIEPTAAVRLEREALVHVDVGGVEL